MSVEETRLLSWHELPPEHWLTPVNEPMNPEPPAEVPWPIEEPVIRRVARREGMLLERLSPERYRLWDLRAQVRGQEWPVPVDLTAMGEYVDSLPGIAYFLSGLV